MYAPHNPPHVLGLDINCTDGQKLPPTSTDLSSDEVLPWFTSHPSGPAPALRLLVLANHSPTSSPTWLSEPRFTETVVNHAIWCPDAYLDLLATPSGGCAALLSEPWCFVLRTPSDDDGPACSLALSRRGHVVKGIYTYQSRGHLYPSSSSTPAFDPLALLDTETIQSSWRSTGLQIIALPLAIAKVHARYIATSLNSALSSISRLETEITHYTPSSSPSPTPSPTPHWTHTLHTLTTTLLALERRARLQSQLLTSISLLTATHPHFKSHPVYPPLAPLHSALSAWQFDLATLPRRIASSRAAITFLLQQRNAGLNLRIAEASREMTQAALRDNATMKAIAILTMVFLPSMAVATFLSMSMFSWSSGGEVGSKWLWVFFAVAGPLTGGVVGGWWVWTRRFERGFVEKWGAVGGGEGCGVRDAESEVRRYRGDGRGPFGATGDGRDGVEEVEMEAVVVVGSKGGG
ncbi:hypothetical protein LTR91_008520 [Friedmanniomyces endolithicus]|uniref:Uncharacterized protein n=1 Tax=Friedmanniomyces endolithicus TaxID=329885 RepID=A0AAN6QU08_9PEZI|nr:hypothetical protein LTR35_003534 [Friedmanniomyces endolithicus]KAK0294028.1 hypothetical protein LTS00_007367 [Friedmanniomyces endolithicus]KAK0321711.1 hypothetical protein LTR82_007197 [Friedmanniomyces endolithicus]KAK0987736.1 hypothetical protein LTS01_009407 [Friedmanniomyces endolithicus]KAK0991495.1 hypothetical protein LTR91_008520 [Friedmanniomyces endolithicus]